jgi:hypothetical protein
MCGNVFCIIIAASMALREVRCSRLMLGSSVSCARYDAVGLEALQRAVGLDELGVRPHDLGRLAVQRQRDVVAVGGEALVLTGLLDAAHHELEVGDVVRLVLGQHQERALVG